MIQLRKTSQNNLILYLGRKTCFKLLHIIEGYGNPRCIWEGERGLISSRFTIGIWNEEDYEIVRETFKEFKIVSETDVLFFNQDSKNFLDFSYQSTRDILYYTHYYNNTFLNSHRWRITYEATRMDKAMKLLGDLRKRNYLVLWRPRVLGNNSLILG